MTPKEKAIELVDNFYQLAENIQWTNDDEKKEKSEKFNDELGNDVLIFWNELAKQSALIAADELINEEEKYNNGSFYHSKYWKEVKQEIEKL